MNPKCATKFCRNRVHINARRGGVNKHCSKCMSRRWREQNPFRYFWNKLRYRAKERGHECSLTLEQFTCFSKIYDLLAHRGRTAMAMSIDRINPNEGYHMWNIQPLSVSENARKGNAERSDDPF